MKYLPVGLDLQGRSCIVVGGGRVGARKLQTLLRADAKVTLVSPEAHVEVEEMARDGELIWVRRGYESKDLEGAFLVVAATNDESLNTRIVRDAQAEGAMLCDASSSQRSQVIFGALLEQGSVTVAVFTDGRDPSLARVTRDRIADLSRDWKAEPKTEE